MAINLHCPARTKAEPWRCECPSHALRSDSPKGPALDLCRQLVDLGIEDGPATVYRDGKPALLIGAIHQAARLTVAEGPATRFVKWQPHPGSWDSDSRESGSAPMRQTKVAATLVAPNPFVDPGASPHPVTRIAA